MFEFSQIFRLTSSNDSDLLDNAALVLSEPLQFNSKCMTLDIIYTLAIFLNVIQVFALILKSPGQTCTMQCALLFTFSR
jgi:hypothetical protein